MNYFNNPFNIRYDEHNSWYGQMKPVNGFCTFCDVACGVRAFVKLMYRYVHILHLCTIREVISRYAPPSENNTSRYVSFVKEKMCFREDDKLDLHKPIEFFNFCCAVARFESNFDLNSYEFDLSYMSVMFSLHDDLFNS